MRLDHPLPQFLRKLLFASAGHRYYVPVVMLIAFAATATGAFPFVFVLIPAVLLTPRRWLQIGLLFGIASGFGGAVMVEVFHTMGRELVLEQFPQVLASAGWQQVSRWLDDYGLLALAFIAGSPIPQTPAVFFYSLANPSPLGAMIAIGLGKTIKYVCLAWLTERFPSRFIRYR